MEKKPSKDLMAKTTTRRQALKAGLAVAALPLIPAMARQAVAQERKTTTVHGFETAADIAKAEQEGEFLYYTHDSEPAAAGIAEAFGKDFPKIKGKYFRLQNSVAVQQGAVRTPGRAIQRRRHPVLRADDGDRFPEARRLHALRLAAGEVLCAGASEQSGRRLFLGGRDLRRHRLQHREGEAGGCAQRLEGHPEADLGQRGQRQAVELGHAVRAVVRAAQALRR